MRVRKKLIQIGDHDLVSKDSTSFKWTQVAINKALCQWDMIKNHDNKTILAASKKKIIFVDLGFVEALASRWGLQLTCELKFGLCACGFKCTHSFGLFKFY